MKRFGSLRCTHKEIAGSPGQIVVTFRTTGKEFGATLLLRVEDIAKEFEIGKEYPLYLGPGEEPKPIAR